MEANLTDHVWELAEFAGITEGWHHDRICSHTLSRKQKRALRRRKAAAQSQVSATEPQQNKKPKPRPKPSRLPESIRKVSGRIWGVLIAIATLASLLGFYILRPDVLIEPYASTDLTSPFGQQFSVQNTSVYAIRNVQPMCGFDQDSGFNIKNFSISSAREKVEALEPGEKTTLTCRVATGPIRQELNIVPWVKYTIPFGIHRCKAARFRGKPGSGGVYIWTYNGSTSCSN
jgi:hypothetical protein